MEVPVPAEVVLSLSVGDDTPITAARISKWTARDPPLSAVANYVRQGWPSNTAEEFAVFHRRRDELSLQQGCILWGSRVIIPVPGRECLLEELHECHPGIVSMKAMARSYLWWRGLDSDIELKVRSCNSNSSELQINLFYSYSYSFKLVKSIASFQRMRTCIHGNGQSVVSTAHRLHGSIRGQGYFGHCRRIFKVH